MYIKIVKVATTRFQSLERVDAKHESKSNINTMRCMCARVYLYFICMAIECRICMSKAYEKKKTFPHDMRLNSSIVRA